MSSRIDSRFTLQWFQVSSLLFFSFPQPCSRLGIFGLYLITYLLVMFGGKLELMSAKANHPAKRKVTNPIESDEYFGAQFQTASELGDPKPVLAFLAQAVIETLAGIRDVEQSARWLSDGVYQQLRVKALACSRERARSAAKALRPNLVIGRISSFSPRDGVIEGVVIVHNRGRARAVAIRLEGYNGRWRAKNLAVL